MGVDVLIALIATAVWALHVGGQDGANQAEEIQNPLHITSLERAISALYYNRFLEKQDLPSRSKALPTI